MKNFPYAETLLGSRITNINRACDLIMFTFETPEKKEIHLHLQCILRVFDSDGRLVICTTNLFDRSPNYRKKIFKRYDWTAPGSTVFDDAIKDYKGELFNTKVSELNVKTSDLFIYFENGMRMEVLASITKYDDAEYCENYRIFDDDKSNDYLV